MNLPRAGVCLRACLLPGVVQAEVDNASLRPSAHLVYTPAQLAAAGVGRMRACTGCLYAYTLSRDYEDAAAAARLTLLPPFYRIADAPPIVHAMERV